MDKELEATFLSINKDELRKKLESIGFRLVFAEYMMKRKTFDFSKVSPGLNKWGRVRQEQGKITMTVKEIRDSSINGVFETEIEVNDFDKAVQIFEECNVPAKSYQENFREEWQKGSIKATIDTWPGLNPFLEIEAENEELIRNCAEELKLKYSDAVFGSIDLIYEKELNIPAGTIIKLPEITFDKIPKK